MVKTSGAYSTTEVFTWRVPLWNYDELGILWVWWVWNASYCRTLQVDKSNTLNYLTTLSIGDKVRIEKHVQLLFLLWKTLLYVYRIIIFSSCWPLSVSTLHPTVPTQLVKVKLIKYPNSQPALRSEGPLTEPDAVVACCSRGTQQASDGYLARSAPRRVQCVLTWRVPLWSYDELGILWVWRVELWWDDTGPLCCWPLPGRE